MSAIVDSLSEQVKGELDLQGPRCEAYLDNFPVSLHTGDILA